MKKIISILLAAAILIMPLCINVSAAEISEYKDKLETLIECHEAEYMMWGLPSPYIEYESFPAYQEAKEVLENPSSTDSDYYYAVKKLLNADLYGDDIHPYFAIETYNNAIKEQNYNNWYSEEDWANYQFRLADLKAAIDDLKNDRDYSKKLTVAFNAVHRTYNKMTNKYTLKGDVNGDGDVNVLDVTLIQKYLVGLEELTGAQKMLSGAYFYEDLDITAATQISKYIVGLIDEIPNNNVFLSDLGISYMEEELLAELILNYNICPRTFPEVRHENGYCTKEYLYGYYILCDLKGYEP